MWNRTQACEPGRHFLLLLLLLEVVNSLPQQRDPLERKEREGGRGEESLDGEFLQCLDHPSRRRTDGRREGETALYITWPATNSAGRSVGRWASESAPFPVQICDRSCNTEHAAAATTGDRTPIKGRGNTSRSLSAT